MIMHQSLTDSTPLCLMMHSVPVTVTLQAIIFVTMPFIGPIF